LNSNGQQMKRSILIICFFAFSQSIWSQHVGINNNNPLERLDVNGNINVITDSSYKIGGYYFVRAKLASNNSWFGKLAGHNSNGTQNLFVGDSTGTSVTGNGNVFVGQSAGRNSTGSNMVIIGRSAAPGILFGDDNTIIGSNAAFLSQYGGSNVIIGKQAAYNNQASFNAYIGQFSGYKNQNGANNVALGYAAGYENINGGNNTNIGMQSGLSVTNGTGNVFLGYQSGFNQTSGDYNVMLGYQAGVFQGNNITASNRNILIGAFSKTTGFQAVVRSVAIGYKSYVSKSDAVAIGGDSTKAVCIGCGDATEGLTIDMPVVIRGDGYDETYDVVAFSVPDVVTVTPTKSLIYIHQSSPSNDRYLDLLDGIEGQEIIIFSQTGIVRIKDAGTQIAPNLWSNIKTRSSAQLDLLTGRAVKLVFLDNVWREL
jgi:hypothetical protein